MSDWSPEHGEPPVESWELMGEDNGVKVWRHILAGMVDLDLPSGQTQRHVGQVVWTIDTPPRSAQARSLIAEDDRSIQPSSAHRMQLVALVLLLLLAGVLLALLLS